MAETDDELTIGPAAELLGVHEQTLRKWADDGKVRHWTTPGGQRRFRRRDLEALRESNVIELLGDEPSNVAG